MTSTYSLRQRFLSASGWALFARVVAALAGFGTNFLIARLLTPEDVGVYFLLVSSVALAISLSQGGLQLAVVRLTADAIAKGLAGLARRTVEQALVIGLAIAALIALTAGLGGALLAERTTSLTLLTPTYGLVGCWIVALSLMGLTAESLRGMHEYRMAAFLSGAIPNLMTVAVLGILTVLAMSVELNLILGIIVVVAAVTGLTGLAWVSRRLSALGPRVAAPVGDLLAVGWPLHVTSLAIFVMTQVDLWLVGALCGSSEVAQYGAAARLLALVMMPMLIGNVILQPLVADLSGRGEFARIQRLAGTIATVSSGVALCALAGIWFAAESILGIAYGEYYRSAATVLILLCSGQAINVLAGPGAIVLMMSGGQKPVMAISMTCGVLLSIGGTIAGLSFGMVGIAAVAGIANALHGLLCLITVWRRNGIWVSAQPWELFDAVRRYRAGVA